MQPSHRARKLLSLLGTLSFPSVLGSPGDYSPGYQRCVNGCNFKYCYTVDPQPRQLPLSLRLFRWTCPDDCAYRCMHDLTQKVVKLPKALPQPGQTFEGWWDEPDWTPGVELEGLPPGRIVQFHGKWPFKRWYGIQEPLAAAFSLLNLLGYTASYQYMKAKIPPRWPLRRLYLDVALVGMNAWVWSIVFHCRDKPWTERLDYFSAAAYALHGLYVSSVRIFRLYPSKAQHYVPLAYRLYLGRQLKLILSALFLVHIAFLSYGERFHYEYNMAVNVMVGVLTILLWLTWTASHNYQTKLNDSTPVSAAASDISADDMAEADTFSDDSETVSPTCFSQAFQSMSTLASTGMKPPYTLRPLLPLVCLVGAGSLELLDFPPIWNMSLDAHALWHLATVPLGPAWCIGFLVPDARWEAEHIEDIRMNQEAVRIPARKIAKCDDKEGVKKHG